MAQPGSALAWGASGRPFKSARPDARVSRGGGACCRRAPASLAGRNSWWHPSRAAWIPLHSFSSRTTTGSTRKASSRWPMHSRSWAVNHLRFGHIAVLTFLTTIWCFWVALYLTADYLASTIGHASDSQSACLDIPAIVLGRSLITFMS